MKTFIKRTPVYCEAKYVVNSEVQSKLDQTFKYLLLSYTKTDLLCNVFLLPPTLGILVTIRCLCLRLDVYKNLSQGLERIAVK